VNPSPQTGQTACPAADVVTDVGPGRGEPLSPGCAAQPVRAHQPLDLAPTDRPAGDAAFPDELAEDLADTVDAAAHRPVTVHPADLGEDRSVTHGPGAPGPAAGRVVGARGDRHAMLGEHPADRLDPEAGPVTIDEGHYQGSRGSVKVGLSPDSPLSS